jgi:tetratricopeptide (TPR) repeat protein
LRIRGEQTFDVPGLDAGRADRIEAEPPAAVALLLERARANGIDLELTPEVGPIVSAICGRLDGLPLAIELAAARLRIFSVNELHDRLVSVLSLGSGATDLPERQRTLRAAIAWTEELLSPTERKAFARLGVFAGGFTLHAAAALADDSSNIEDDVLSLVDQSIVQRLGVVAGVSRFGMLEMVREYAVERLEQSLEGDEVRDGLASHMLKLAEQLEPALVGDGQQEALMRLDAELANLRLALGWLRDRRDDRLCRLTASLARYWGARGLLGEGRRWVRESQAASSDDQPIVAARLLHADGMLANEQGELNEAVGLLRAAADTYGAAGDMEGLTRVLVTLSSAQQAAGILDEAMDAATEAAELAHGLGDLRSGASATGNLAIIALKQGRIPDAQEGIARAIEMLKRAGDRLGVVIGLGNLGAIAAQVGDFEQAIEYQTEALASAIALGSHDLEAWARLNLATAMYRRGDRANAAPLVADAIEQLVAVEDTIAVVNALPFAAALLATPGDTRTALTAWSAAESNAERMGIELEVDEADRSTIHAIRASADANTLDACAREGATLAPNEAAALVVARLRSAPS